MPSRMLFLRPLLALLSLTLPLAAQVELPRQVPEDAVFAATLDALKAGMDDGFASLRGERLDEDSWQPVLPAGLVNDDARDPAERRHTFGAFSYSQSWVIKLTLQKTYKPSEEEVASLEADYKQLGAAMFAAAGDWQLESKTTTSQASMTSLLRPTGEERPPFIRLILTRGESWGEAGWWELKLFANAPLSGELPVWAASDPATYRGFPTDASFAAAVEAMKAGAYTGLEQLKGLVAPREVSDRHGGYGFHSVWSNLPAWIEELEVERLASEAGLSPGSAAAGH